MINRKQKALKNIIIAFFSNILIYLLSLFTSKIIKEKLGLDILGLNGVLTNIISILSLTELGVGAAITFALYEPLASQNIELIKSIMAFYKRTYRIIALLVAVIGLLLLPVIPLFIKGSLFSKKYLFIVYLLFLMNSVLSYLLIYKRTLIVADQRNYIVTTVTLFYTYALKIFQLVAVFFTSNYILFLLIQIICTLIYNLIISFICDKLYPFLKAPSKKLDQEYYKYAGLCFRRMTKNFKILGDDFPTYRCSGTSIDIAYKWKCIADKAEVFKTSMLRKHPFPDIKWEKFCQEAIIWFKIAQDKNGLLLCINKGIYICEYLPDGLSANLGEKMTNSSRYSLLWSFTLLSIPYEWKNLKQIYHHLKTIIYLVYKLYFKRFIKHDS